MYMYVSYTYLFVFFSIICVTVYACNCITMYVVIATMCEQRCICIRCIQTYILKCHAHILFVLHTKDKTFQS